MVLAQLLQQRDNFCCYEYCHIEGRERHRALHPIEWRLLKGPPAEDGQEAVQSDPRGNRDGQQDGESRAARSGREALDRPLEWTGASNVFSSQPHNRLDRVLDMGRRWRRDFFCGASLGGNLRRHPVRPCLIVLVAGGGL